MAKQKDRGMSSIKDTNLKYVTNQTWFNKKRILALEEGSGGAFESVNVGGNVGIKVTGATARTAIGKHSFDGQVADTNPANSPQSKNDTILGGIGNRIVPTPGYPGHHNFIGAGIDNYISSFSEDDIYDGNSTIYNGNTILTGYSNNISYGSVSSLILSGFRHTIEYSSVYSAIVHGLNNEIYGGKYSFIGNGWDNSTHAGLYSTIVNGGGNYIEDSYSSFIGNGDYNLITNTFNSFIGSGGENNITNTFRSFIGSGKQNNLTDSYYGFIGAGVLNSIEGCDHSTIFGLSNVIEEGNYSLISGRNNSISILDDVNILGSNITASRDNCTFVNNLNIKDIPTSSAGLSTGDLWNNGGVINIV